MYCCTVAMCVGDRVWSVVSFEDDAAYGGAWRLRRLLALTGGFRTRVTQSTYDTARADRIRMMRDLLRRGFTVEDMNRDMDANVVLAYEVVLELEEHGLVQWSVVQSVA